MTITGSNEAQGKVLTYLLCPEALVCSELLTTLSTAYTQVASLTVYSYLFMSLFANQYLEPRGEALDMSTFKTLNISFSLQSNYISHTPGKFR